jgi:hypothetical protein
MIFQTGGISAVFFNELKLLGKGDGTFDMYVKLNPGNLQVPVYAFFCFILWCSEKCFIGGSGWIRGRENVVPAAILHGLPK